MEAQGHHPRRRGRRLGRRSRTRSSASSRATTSCSAASSGSSPSASAARTRPRTAPRSTAPARRCTSRRAPAAPATARRAHAVPRRRQGRSARSCAAMRIDLPKKVRALGAASMRCRPRPRTAASSCRRGDARRTAKTKALRDALRASSASTNALIIDGAEVDANFAPGGAQHPEHRRAAGPGHQRLRHSAAAQAGADQGRRRGAGGALQMSTTDPRHYDVISSPVITEKATIASEQQPGDLQRRPQGHQAADQGGGRGAVRRQGEERQHAVRKGKIKRFRGTVGTQCDVKKAIVTLDEGHRIDVTTGSVSGAERTDGTQDIQAGHAEPAPAGARRPRRAFTRASRSRR